MCEKNLSKVKDVFCEFTDLEKPYDTVDGRGMRQMLRVYHVYGVVRGKLLKAVKRFHVDGMSQDVLS